MHSYRRINTGIILFHYDFSIKNIKKKLRTNKRDSVRKLSGIMHKMLIRRVSLKVVF